MALPRDEHAWISPPPLEIVNMLVLIFWGGVNWESTEFVQLDPKITFDWLSSQSFHPSSQNSKLKNKSAFVRWKYIKWLTHTVGRFFGAVCTLEFQAYGHGNFYQYSKAIEDGGDIQKRASAVKQRSKSSGLTHAHQTVCRLSQSLNGTKSKVVDASGWSALLRYCTRGLFRQLQHWLHCVKANQRGKWREQSCRTHTMHKWQRSDGGGERCFFPGILKTHFGIQAQTYAKLFHTRKTARHKEAQL